MNIVVAVTRPSSATIYGDRILVFFIQTYIILLISPNGLLAAVVPEFISWRVFNVWTKTEVRHRGQHHPTTVMGAAVVGIFSFGEIVELCGFW